MDASGRVSELFCLVRRHFGLDRDSVLSMRRTRHVAARAAIATRMRREGYSLAEIGMALERDPSTIHHLLTRTSAYALADQALRPAFVAVTESP